MKTEWDYTDLADAYLKRPDYSQSAIDKMFDIAGVKKGDDVCDVGTGAAHLTLKLAEYELQEAKRILKNDGWFACMWNHRDLDDPLQKEIENISQIADYNYGTRREDQTEIIDQSGLFGDVVYIERSVVHEILAEDFIESWRSHGTVQRQSKDKFDLINQEIRKVVEAKGEKYIKVPYTTRIWMAQVK